MGFLFPTISAFLCCLLFYILGHNINDGDFQTVSISLSKFPENRFFAVCMSIESCILGSIFYIRHKLISKMAKRYSQRKITENSESACLKTPIKNLNHISDALGFITCICLTGFSSVTLDDSRFIHLSFEYIFWISFLLYFIISDIAAKRAHFSIRFISLILPYFIICFAAVNLFIVFRCSPDESRKANNIYAITQYFVGFLLFFKILLIGYDYPPHDLVSSSSKTKVKLT